MLASLHAIRQGPFTYEGTASLLTAKLSTSALGSQLAMNERIDTASRLICASPIALYCSFSTPGALESWLPPHGMTGSMLEFDFREGGHYKMRLTYKAPQAVSGKTSDNSDDVTVFLRKLDIGRSIEQEVAFISDDLSFAGNMQIVWTFRPDEDGTLVTVFAENVPPGINQQEHLVGLNASLKNLAIYVERKSDWIIGMDADHV
jgi:uncharacterized protein YndB with AHSA1/START domain